MNDPTANARCIEFVSDGIGAINREFKLTYVNPALVEMFGYVKASDLVGRDVLEFVASESRHEILRRLASRMEGSAVPYETRLRDRAGSSFPAKIVPVVITDQRGGTVGSIAVIRDLRVVKGLEQQLENLAHIIDYLPICVAYLDDRCRYRYMNRRYAAVFGIDVGGSIGQHPEDVLAPGVAAELAAPVSQALEGNSVEYEVRIHTSDGPRWFRGRNAPAPAMAGKGAGSFVVLHDDTVRKFAARSLADSERQLAAAERFARIGSWRREETGSTVWSEGVYHVLGLDRSTSPELRTFLDMVHPDDVSRLQQIREAAVAGGEPFAIDVRFVRPDGETRQLHLQGATDTATDGAPGATFGTMQDVTDRKRIEQSLRDSEERFRELAETIDEVFWLSSPDQSEMYYVSPAFERITGRSTDSVTNDARAWTTMIHPDDRERVRRAGVVDGTLEPFDQEYRIVRPDGEERWLHARAYPVLGGDGAVVRTTGIASDITDRKRADQQLADLYAELEARVTERTVELQNVADELESFAYSVSHDLRAPLRAIDGFAQALREESADDLDEGGLRYLGKIQAAATRMDRLISDLLSLSQLAREEMTEEPIELAGVARRIVDQLRSRELDRKIEFVVPDELWARGDRALLTVVLQNLLENSWKYTATEPAVRIEFGRDGETGPFFVRDNGVGFDMTYADRLFRPFQRLHRRGQFEGNGIGLATVRRIVSRHGGKVWADAQKGVGATLFFTLGEVAGE